MHAMCYKSLQGHLFGFQNCEFVQMYRYKHTLLFAPREAQQCKSFVEALMSDYGLRG